MDVSSVVIKGMQQAAIIPSVIWQTNDSVAVPDNLCPPSPLQLLKKCLSVRLVYTL
jgi:hypothetical protein